MARPLPNKNSDRQILRSSDNLVGSWIEIESSTEEEDSDAEVLE